MIWILLSIAWLFIGWLALEGHIDVKNENLWLLLFGTPSIFIIIFGFIYIFIRSRRK